MVEGTGAGCQWSTVFQASGPDDNFSMGDCILMMALNGITYMFMAFYIEAVRPGDYGVPLPWNFLFTVSTHKDHDHDYITKKRKETSPHLS